MFSGSRGRLNPPPAVVFFCPEPASRTGIKAPSIRDAGPVLAGWFWQALLDEPPHIAWVGHVEVLALQNKKPRFPVREVGFLFLKKDGSGN